MRLERNVALLLTLVCKACGFVSLTSTTTPQAVVMMSTATVQEETKQTIDGDREPNMKAFASGYKTVFEEVPCRICTPTTGEIPSDLVGTYYRTGPAMFSAGSIVPPKTSIVKPKQGPVPDGQDPERMVRHPFEADGAVLGITFGCGNDNDDDENGSNRNDDNRGSNQAVMRFRYVRTVALNNERRKGQKAYNGMESTRELGSDCALGLGNDLALPLHRHHLQPGLNKNRKNTSNTRAIYWGKRLLSLWEGGQPYKLDDIALSTEGRSQLGGAIPKEEDPFGCKMVVDPKTDRALFYGITQDAKESQLTVYEFSSDFRLVPNGRSTFPLPGFAVLNDFAATERYSVFIQPPVSTNGMQFMFNKEPGKVTSLEQGGAALLHLIPRTGFSVPAKSMAIPVDDIPDANLQFVNAYEEEDNVIVDVIRTSPLRPGQRLSQWPWADTLAKYQAASGARSLWRYTANTKKGTVAKQCLSTSNCAFGGVNPAVSTLKHDFVYMNVGGGGGGNRGAPPQGVARYDCRTGVTDTWLPSDSEFCGEPMFAPRAGGSGEEDDGYVLTVLLNGARQESELVVLDAKQISAGPVTRIPLGMVVPHGLFGCFAPDATWSTESIERRAKLADKMESRGNMWNEVKSDFSGLGLRLDDIDEYFPGLFG